MTSLRLPWKLFALFILMIALCQGLAGWIATRELYDFYISSQRESLTNLGHLILPEAARLLRDPDVVRPLEREFDALAESTDIRVTLIAPDGRVLRDTDQDPAVMDNHNNRPEIIEALDGHPGTSVRLSNTLNMRMLYVAAPVVEGGEQLGVLRIARPLAAIDAEVAQIHRILWQSGLLAVVIAALICLYVARRVSRPVVELRDGARRLARGDLSERVGVAGSVEIRQLAEALNQTAAHLEQRLAEITRERNEREAILASMTEGVLAIDLDDRILMINPAAEAILGLNTAAALGRFVQEVLRQPELQKFLARAMAGEAIPAEETILRWSEDRFLQVAAAPLRNEAGREIGLLLLLADVTQLHQLEKIRRDFVANVSHELRTPVTSLMGFIETLREGALEEPEQARRFLQIMANQTVRLNATIEDLLALSRIERERQGEGIEYTPTSLRSLLENVLQQHQVRLDEKQFRVKLEVPEGLVLNLNDRLVEQAVGNLIDNALKYCPLTPLTVNVERDASEFRIQVIDGGPGIPLNHQARLFERFYRVDASRSRALGGTGLGLAIAKHIAQAHGGSVSLQSVPGQGATFTVHLPASLVVASET